MFNRLRQHRGSTLILIVLTICFVLLPILVVVNQFGLYSVDQSRVQYVVEGAGLVAANDLSRVVINDPHFGYVSLSNHPPVGNATRAPDGDPLPVTGINTWIGTIRQSTIIAKELHNETMMQLADTDRGCLAGTIRSMNTMIRQSVSGNGSYIDCQGQPVSPLSDVTEFLKANLPGNLEVVSVQLSNGWLSEGGTTTIHVPQPKTFAYVSPEDFQGRTYKAFTNLPVGDRSFEFAGLGTASTIATAARFQPANDGHICSVVKIDCTVAIKNPLRLPFKNGSLRELRCVACCEPYSLPDAGPGGAMTVKFSGQPVSGLQSWNDFLKQGNFRDYQVNTYDVQGGDYMADPHARSRRSPKRPELGAAQQFSEHLYYWLRNEHVRPKIDSVMAMIDEPFDFAPNQIYAYLVNKEGTIERRKMSGDPFPAGVVSDSQMSSVVDTRISNEVAPIIMFRDNVANLSIAQGGKHCGQPIAGNPDNWSELAQYGGSGWQAASPVLSIFNSSDSESRLVAVAPENKSTNQFISVNLKDLSRDTRKSTYASGLAVAIDIGGIKPSTAFQDVSRMRKMRR